MCWVAFISFINLIESDKHVIKDVIRPKAMSVGDHEKKIRNYWTPQRLANATEFRMNLPSNSTRSTTSSSKAASKNESSISFPGSLPIRNNTVNKAALASATTYATTTGRVFWVVGAYQYSCSGSVVKSTSGDLVVTAAHCVYDTSSKTWFVNNYWIFVPGYKIGTAPYGIWTARRMIVSSSWISSTDMNADVAFVAVSTINSIHLQSYVGSQGIGFNFPRLAYTYAYGYPMNINSGLTLQQCVGYAQKSKWTYNNFIGQGLSCTMGGGSSGGPWIQNMASTGIGFITSVNSFSINTVPNVMNGPYFTTTTATLYSSATAM